MKNFREINEKSQLNLGDLVFKGRKPGETGYSLPDKYKKGGDLTDYYHVGVVTNISPLQITHCTSVPGGIKIDSQLGKWKYAGELKQIKERGMTVVSVLYNATVVSENGKGVNLRNGCDRREKLLKTVKPGTVVGVLDECDAEWAHVQCGTVDGYMMRKFLQPIGEKQDEDDDGEIVTITMPKNVYDALCDALLNGMSAG